MNDNRQRLNTRLPPILWLALRRIAAGLGLTPDEAIRKLIADAGGVEAQETAQEPPGSTIDRGALIDPSVPIRRS